MRIRIVSCKHVARFGNSVERPLGNVPYLCICVAYVYDYYLRRRLASEGIVTFGVTLRVCPPSRYHASTARRVIVSAATVMRCIQWSLVVAVL